MTTTDASADIAALMERQGLTVEAEFVNHSESGNAKEKPCLNWKIKLMKGTSVILETDYTAGAGHAPSYPLKHLIQERREKCIAYECEYGYAMTWRPGFATPIRVKPPQPIMPDPVDVFASLVMDADARCFPDFETWADDHGYDTDSRKAEAIYEACLSIGLKLMNAIGDFALREATDLANEL